ncbi:hypothetical protein TI39_contig4120g00005 [Zymoseptoria brevis]|uniref:F-box domain-containing protein n=1 Tax=Zymoseptoria brevis TaxID=1047168 RepID=A0A0F4GD36_9PEZI|nr:hypothetical protein TI39_contig4120g00005 [Zymoseptoria brevis]
MIRSRPHRPAQLDIMANHPPKNIQDVHHGSSPPDDGIKATAGDHAELSDHASTRPPSTPAPAAQPEARGIAAEKVFGTGELLEETLSYLDPADILNAMIVQRHWRDSIEGSVKLKRLLGLAAGGKFFYSPFFGSSVEISHRSTARIVERPLKGSHVCMASFADPALRTRKAANPGPDHGHYHVRIDFTVMAHADPVEFLQHPEALLQDPGSRIRAMAICNPPIHRLSANMECWGCEDREGGDAHLYLTPFYSSSDIGLTVGEVADEVMSLARSNHRHCSMRCFFFSGLVVVQPDDPIAKTWLFEDAAHETREKYRELVKVAFQSDEEKDVGKEKANKEHAMDWSQPVVDAELQKRADAVVLPWLKPRSCGNCGHDEWSDDEDEEEDEEGYDGGFVESSSMGEDDRDEEEHAEEEHAEEEHAEEEHAEEEHAEEEHAEEELEWSDSPSVESEGEAEDGDDDHDEAEPASSSILPAQQPSGTTADDECGYKQE